MGYRIHTAEAKYVRVSHQKRPERYFNDEEMAVGPALVLDDGGNMEAFVLVGDPEQLRQLALRVLNALPVKLTTDEKKYLKHICAMYAYDRKAGTIGRDPSGWAWFLSAEDSTSFDLTNQQTRELP